MTLLTEKTGTGGTEILKTNVLGRVWTPRDRREALVAEYERSAMSAAEFAKWSGVKYATFTGWVVKVRRVRRGEEGETKAPTVPGAMRWAEAVCAEPDSGKESAVVIHLGGGVRVETRNGRVAAAGCRFELENSTSMGASAWIFSPGHSARTKCGSIFFHGNPSLMEHFCFRECSSQSLT